VSNLGIFDIVVIVIIMMFSITMHEIAHGFVAYLRGDNTAKDMGRLTFNPIAHVDLIGTILLPLAMLILGSPVVFGWAKPVPVNYNNLKKPKTDIALVAAAGAATNILIAIIAGLVIRALALANFLSDGSFIVLYYIFIMNLAFAVLNLIPIPPLDGSKVLASFLPRNAAYKYLSINDYVGFLLVMILIATGIFGNIVLPIIWFSFKLLTGITG